MRIFSALLMISVASTGAAVAGPFEGLGILPKRHVPSN